ncbi:hypothetical protein D3C74_374430 [compost metagenome]
MHHKYVAVEFHRFLERLKLAKRIEEIWRQPKPQVIRGPVLHRPVVQLAPGDFNDIAERIANGRP